jgi:hypothetical protein
MTDSQRRAAEAWKQVVRRPSPLDVFNGEPMPLWAAVDYVMEAGVERTEAELRLQQAAQEWIRQQFPDCNRNSFSNYLSTLAKITCDEMLTIEGINRRGFNAFDTALAVGISSGHFAYSCEDWRLWLKEAERALDLLEQMERV